MSVTYKGNFFRLTVNFSKESITIERKKIPTQNTLVKLSFRNKGEIKIFTDK